MSKKDSIIIHCGWCQQSVIWFLTKNIAWMPNRAVVWLHGYIYRFFVCSDCKYNGVLLSLKVCLYNSVLVIVIWMMIIKVMIVSFCFLSIDLQEISHFTIWSCTVWFNNLQGAYPRGAYQRIRCFHAKWYKGTEGH